MEEYELHMKDFEPSDMITIELPPGEEMTLHEDQRDETSIYIRGAYYTNSKIGSTNRN